jgi:hypothetical protein
MENHHECAATNIEFPGCEPPHSSVTTPRYGVNLQTLYHAIKCYRRWQGLWRLPADQLLSPAQNTQIAAKIK